MQGASPEGARSAGPSRMRAVSLFLRSCAFDFLCVLVVSTALVFTVSFGFNSAPDLRGNVVLIAGVCAVVLACLYVGMFSRRLVLVAAAAYVVASALLVAAIGALSPEQVPLFEGGQLNDVEANYAVFAMVAVVVPLAVFVLSRTSWSMPLLLLAAALACGSIQFLYRDWVVAEPALPAALFAFGGIGALFVVQGYRRGVLASKAVKKTSFFAAFAFGAVISALCMAVAAALFFLVVNGLGLATLDVKPFEDYYARPVVEYDGTYDQQQVIDPDLGTNRLSEEEGDTIEDASGDLTEDEPDDSGGGFSFVNAVTNMLDIDDWNAMFDAVRYDLPLPLRVLLALLPLLVIAAIVFARRQVRVRRLEKLAALGPSGAVVELYGFLSDRLGRLGVARSPSLTPLEFALASGDELSAFSQNAAHADFLAVTLAYQRAAFGAGAQEHDWELVKSYYESFFAHARQRMGALKWAFWGFWRI